MKGNKKFCYLKERSFFPLYLFIGVLLVIVEVFFLKNAFE